MKMNEVWSLPSRYNIDRAPGRCSGRGAQGDSNSAQATRKRLPGGGDILNQASINWINDQVVSNIHSCSKNVTLCSISPDCIHALCQKGGWVMYLDNCQFRWLWLCSLSVVLVSSERFLSEKFLKLSKQLTESSLFIQTEGLLSSSRLCDSACILEGFTLSLMPLYPTTKAAIFSSEEVRDMSVKLVWRQLVWSWRHFCDAKESKPPVELLTKLCTWRVTDQKMYTF